MAVVDPLCVKWMLYTLLTRSYSQLPVSVMHMY